MIITKEILHKGKSVKGAFNKRQIEALGENWPLTKGWYDRILGKEVSEEDVNKFLNLKNTHLKPKYIEQICPCCNQLYKEFLFATEGI